MCPLCSPFNCVNKSYKKYSIIFHLRNKSFLRSNWLLYKNCIILPHVILKFRGLIHLLVDSFKQSYLYVIPRTNSKFFCSRSAICNSTNIVIFLYNERIYFQCFGTHNVLIIPHSDKIYISYWNLFLKLLIIPEMSNFLEKINL